MSRCPMAQARWHIKLTVTVGHQGSVLKSVCYKSSITTCTKYCISRQKTSGIFTFLAVSELFRLSWIMWEWSSDRVSWLRICIQFWPKIENVDKIVFQQTNNVKKKKKKGKLACFWISTKRWVNRRWKLIYWHKQA